MRCDEELNRAWSEPGELQNQLYHRSDNDLRHAVAKAASADQNSE